MFIIKAASDRWALKNKRLVYTVRIFHSLRLVAKRRVTAIMKLHGYVN